MSGEWFASWFDSPYYPLLYSHRDEQEARNFIGRLLDRLQPPTGSHFLDLACGRGRHSRYLHSRGYKVTGLDLSPESIADAQEPPAAGLDFRVHDMRQPFPGSYDYILNLFTSFGYFPDDDCHAAVLRNVAAALRPGGVFVIDFLNEGFIVPRLIPVHDIEKNGIRFHIHKRFENGTILKDIEVTDPAQSGKLYYRESVRAFTRPELETMLTAAGLQPYEAWGSYEGDAYVRDQSQRLIIFSRLPKPGMA